MNGWMLLILAGLVYVLFAGCYGVYIVTKQALIDMWKVLKRIV